MRKAVTTSSDKGGWKGKQQEDNLITFTEMLSLPHL